LWIAGIAKSCSKPNAALFIDHSVMVVRSGVPDFFTAPVGRRLHELVTRGMTGAECFGDAIAHRRDDARGSAFDRVEHGNHVGAVLGRTVERPVSIDCRIAAIGSD